MKVNLLTFLKRKGIAHAGTWALVSGEYNNFLIKLLSENKLIICVQVQMFLLKSDKNFLLFNKHSIVSMYLNRLKLIHCYI